MRYIDAIGGKGKTLLQNIDEIEADRGDRIFSGGMPVRTLEELENAEELTIVKIPADPITIGVTAVIAVATIVTTIVAAVKANEARKDAEKAIEQAKKFSQIDRPNPAASIRGGRNRYRANGRIPILFGRHMVVPDLAGAPYTSYENDEQYFHQVFCFGYNNVTITRTPKIGDNTVDLYEHETGDGLAFYDKLVSELTIGASLKHGKPISHTTPNRTTRIEVGIIFPSGLRSYDDNAEEVERTVTIRVSWPERNSHDLTITENKDKVRRNVTIQNPSKQATTVTVERITPDGDAQRDVDNAYWDVMRSFIETPEGEETPISADMLAECNIRSIKIKATEQLKGVIDQFSAIAESRMRVWKETGSGPGVWEVLRTSNPASALLHLLTSPQIAKHPVPDDKIVWEEFEQWYLFCKEKGFQFNAVMAGDFTIAQIAKDICTAGRGMMYSFQGSYGVRIEEVSTNIDFQLTPRNTRGGMVFNRKLSDVPDSLTVRFIDETTDYQEVVRTLGIDQGGTISYDIEPGKNTDEISLTGITNPEQAMKIGAFKLAKANRRTISISVPQDWEQLTAFPGAIGYLSSDMFLYGLSSGKISNVISSAGITTQVRIDEPVNLSDTTQYSIMVRMNDETEGIKIYPIESPAQAGVVEEVTLDTPVTEGLIETGNQYIIGERGKEALKVICESISQGAEMGGVLTLVPYAEEIFQADSGNIPAWEPNITLPRSTITGQPFDQEARIEETERELAKVKGGVLGSLVNGFEFTREGQAIKTTVPKKMVIRADGAYNAIIIEFERQPELTNFLRYEIQTSENGTNWFAVNIDGTRQNYTGAAGQWFSWYNETLVHPVPPIAGPAGRTMQYRARIVVLTANGEEFSAISDVVSAQTNLVESGTIATHAVTANEIATTALNTLIANIKSNLTIGRNGYSAFAGDGTIAAPLDGDKLVFIDDDELNIMVYKAPEWRTKIKIGGEENAIKIFDENEQTIKTTRNIGGIPVTSGDEVLEDRVIIGAKGDAIRKRTTEWQTVKVDKFSTAGNVEARWIGHNNRFLAVNDEGQYITSEDGALWLLRQMPEPIEKIVAVLDMNSSAIVVGLHTVWKTEDLQTWEKVETRTESLNGATGFSRVARIVGTSGLILSTEDEGSTWTTEQVSTAITLNDISNGPVWVAVGGTDAHAIVLTQETDGAGWTGQWRQRIFTTSTTKFLQVKLGEESYVTATEHWIASSTDNGETWAIRYAGPITEARGTWDIAYNDSAWIIGSAIGFVWRSEDYGASFRATRTPSGESITDASDGIEDFLVGDARGRLLLSEDDGITWELVGESEDQERFIAITEGASSKKIAITRTGIVVSQQNIEINELAIQEETGLGVIDRGLMIKNGEWAFNVHPDIDDATGDRTLSISLEQGGSAQMEMYVEDSMLTTVFPGNVIGEHKTHIGRQWETARYTAQGNDLEAVTASRAGGRTTWFAVGRNGTIMQYRTNWQQRTSPTTANLRSVASSKDKVIAVGDGGTAVVWDGANWSNNNPGGGNLRKIVYNKYTDVFVAVGDGGRVLTCPGTGTVSWTERQTPRSTTLRDIAISESEMIAVGDGGVIIRSRDPSGTFWTRTNLPGRTDGRFRVVYYTGRWAITGDNGTIIDSTDGGITWTERHRAEGEHIEEIAYGNGRWIAVMGGEMISSTDDMVTWGRIRGDTAEPPTMIIHKHGRWLLLSEISEAYSSRTGNADEWTEEVPGVGSNTEFPTAWHYFDGDLIIVGTGGQILHTREVDIFKYIEENV